MLTMPGRLRELLKLLMSTVAAAVVADLLVGIPRGVAAAAALAVMAVAYAATPSQKNSVPARQLYAGIHSGLLKKSGPGIPGR